MSNQQLQLDGMLQSVSKNVSRLRDIANDKTGKKLQQLLIDVNDQLLTEVIDILQPFDDATRMLSADKTPTQRGYSSSSGFG